MRLQQLRFHFNYKDSNETVDVKNAFLSFTDKINPENKISLDKTFVIINSEYQNQIKGYSIIKRLIEEGCKIYDNENKEIILENTEIPFIQMSDESIEEEEYIETVEKIKEFSPVANTEEKAEEGSEADKPPVDEPLEVPYEWGQKYLQAKEKLQKLGYKSHGEDGIGFFWKGENSKLIIDKGDDIDVLNNTFEYEDEKINLKVDKDGNLVVFEITPKSEPIKEKVEIS